MRADREAPVIALLRRAALEHDHRRDGVRAADVRDVEALDPHREGVQVQRGLQAVERVHALLALALGLELLLVERELGVALGQLEDAALAAALGRADLHLAAAPLAQQLAEHPELRALGHDALHDDQRRDAERARVELEHELLDDDRRVLLGLVVEVEGLPVGEHAVADLEDLRVGLRALERDGDRVVGAGAALGHALALQQRLHGLQPVALDRRLLVVLLAGGEVHLLLEVALDLLEATGQERDHAVDPLAVLLLGDVADAGRPAALDVVVQARRAGVAAGLGALARAEQEDLAEQVQRVAHALGATSTARSTRACSCGAHA